MNFKTIILVILQVGFPHGLVTIRKNHDPLENPMDIYCPSLFNALRVSVLQAKYVHIVNHELYTNLLT